MTASTMLRDQLERVAATMRFLEQSMEELRGLQQGTIPVTEGDMERVQRTVREAKRELDEHLRWMQEQVRACQS